MTAAGRARLFGLATALVVAACATGCTSGWQPDAAATSAAVSVAPSIPADDESAIRRTIDALNVSASGTVAGQQSVLRTLVEPALTSALNDCPPATTTLRFEPVYPGLRPSPDWTGSADSLTGTVYALPTLIRIYTADRITGTDLTTVHLAVDAGEAYITPLCVG